MARAPLVRPTDAPPAAHELGATRGACRADRGRATSRCCRPTTCRATSRSSWTATAAGPAQRGLPELEGHAAGVEAIRELLRHAVRRGIPVLTLYAFSRENWARSDDEVVGLFGLLEAAIRSETDELRAQGVRVRLLGRLDELPDATRASIEEALAATAGGDRLLLNIAFNYAGRTELVDAVRRLAASGIAARRDRRGRDRAAPLHGRPARSRTSSSGPAASSASRTS